MLAHERLGLLRGAYQQSRNGRIIISDRYPSDLVGAIDGATFKDEAIDREPSALKRFLMNWERSMYNRVCSPDMVLHLSIPVDMAVYRNMTRNKEGDQTQEDVRIRHSTQLIPVFNHCPVVQFSTDRDFDEMLVEVKQEVWKRL